MKTRPAGLFLGLFRCDDGTIQAEVTQYDHPETTKRGLLCSIYNALVRSEVVSLQDFAKFRGEVEATDLSDEGLAPVFHFCHSCGDHGLITTYAGTKDNVNSFEGMMATLTYLTAHSLITADEAKMLETQAREQMPMMPEEEPYVVQDSDDMSTELLSVIFLGGSPNHGGPAVHDDTTQQD